MNEQLKKLLTEHWLLERSKYSCVCGKWSIADEPNENVARKLWAEHVAGLLDEKGALKP